MAYSERQEQARRYFKGISRARFGLKRIRAELDAFEESTGVNGTDYSAIRVSSSPNPDGVHNLVQRKQALVERYRDQMAEYVDAIAEANRAIESLGDEELKEVLSYRYLQGLTQDETADAMLYSRQWVVALQSRALEEVWDFIPLSYRE